MLRVLADGENRHRLENHDGAPIGWIRGRTIGFGGLAGTTDVLRAAMAGARALHAALRREYPGWPQYEPTLDALRLVHDGAYEWVSDGKVPIARVVRTRADDGAAPALAIEYVLPSFASEGVAITIAQALGRALDGHLVAAADRGRATPITTDGWLPDDAA